MKQTILYVGLDVDDTQYHGSAFDQHTGAVLDFQCRPTLKGLLRYSPDLEWAAILFVPALADQTTRDATRSALSRFGL